MGKPLSLATVAGLKAITGGARYGFDIMDVTELPSGTVYPILGRLERQGFVAARWEPARTAQREKRPPRRYYDVTANGRQALLDSIEHYRTVGGLFPSPRRASD